MGVHVRLVLLLAVHKVVGGSRIQHAKLLFGEHDSSTRIKDPLAEEKAREVGQGKKRYAAADLHVSLGPKEQLTIDEQPSFHGTDLAEGASLVQNKANSSDTFLVHARAETDKVNSTAALGSTFWLADFMSGFPGKGLTSRGRREDMQALGGRGQTHGLLLAGISGFLVIVCCICYCGVSLLRYGKKAPKAGKKQRLSTESKKSVLSFERKPYIYGGREVFEWEQSGAQIKLYVKVPEGLTKSDLDIKIGLHHLQIGCVGKEPFMKEEVYDKVNVEDSGWRLRSNGELQIMLQKDDCSVWPRVLK